mmetsp:Transcript_85056/g.127499  ORF Transcript_85056/g.127499 Transcript_85056/m.127499 type:complete len:206 (-) Transcript_85056:196-813(-)
MLFPFLLPWQRLSSARLSASCTFSDSTSSVRSRRIGTYTDVSRSASSAISFWVLVLVLCAEGSFLDASARTSRSLRSASEPRSSAISRSRSSMATCFAATSLRSANTSLRSSELLLAKRGVPAASACIASSFSLSLSRFSLSSFSLSSFCLLPSATLARRVPPSPSTENELEKVSPIDVNMLLAATSTLFLGMSPLFLECTELSP